MRAVTDLPLAVGFGISKPEQCAELRSRWRKASWSGSAIVRLIEKHGAIPDLEAQLESFTRELARDWFGAHA